MATCTSMLMSMATLAIGEIEECEGDEGYLCGHDVTLFSSDVHA